MQKLTDSYLDRKKFFLLLFCSIVVYGISFYHQYANYQNWMKHPEVTVIDDVLAMSGNDSYYWLKVARELDAGNIGIGKTDLTKGYPEGSRLAHADTASLLAYLISFVRQVTGGSYYFAGLMLSPLLAGLFVVPLFLYFYRLRFGEAAIFAGLFSVFSRAYDERVLLGRVDTDLLNVFFPLAISCFILPIDRQRSWRTNLGLSAGAGLAMQLFVRWYQQSSFIAVYFCVLLVYLLLRRLPWRQVLGALALYLLCSGPGFVQEVFASLQVFFNAYFAEQVTGTIIWPNLFGVINEAKVQGAGVVLHKIYPFLPLLGVGFVGLGYLCLRHFRQMIPLAPLIGIGCWSLIGPNRFAMYLVPMLAIGLGVVLQLGVELLWRRFHLTQLRASLASLLLLVLVLVGSVAYSGVPETPPTIFEAATTRAILEVKKLVPQHAAMFTPFWEFGYHLMETGDFATFHDGSLQGGMRTTLIAQATMSPDQGDMVSLLAYLADNGFHGLRRAIQRDKLDGGQLLELAFRYPKPFSGENVYILYLEPMLWKTEMLSRFGNWDFETRKSEPSDYFDLPCYALRNNILQCSDGTVDLSRGLMNNGQVDIPLKKVVYVNDGYLLRSQDYPQEAEYYLQILMRKGKIDQILVAGERLYHSNFNQQFLLGNYDRNAFEEVYNDYPIARVLKVKKGAVGHSAD